jgi:membrane protease YdiL (CAAX protease family)|tara:strand:- start:550 stop:1110 length:561 start_codon:yes stop_codon:yes gene_type:complete
MLIVYVIPAIWWLKRNNKGGTFNSLGLSFPKGQKFLILGTGLALYSIALAVFMLWPPQSCGFTFWQANRCTDTVPSDWALTLPLICIMAMITDLWTRGFVLLQAADKWGERPAILLQNTLWLILHLYELELLAPSMSWVGAIALALFLGLVGDIIALRTRSVVGLMAGHALLNIGWAISLATWFSP